MAVESRPVSLELDSIIYSLQGFGGITQYWQEICARMESRDGFEVRYCTAPSWHRLLKVNSQARVFHSSYYRVARGRGVRNVVTVHDFAFERGHVGSGWRRRLACRERKLAYLSADALICGSDSARRDLLLHYPELDGRRPITVIHHGPTLDASITAAPEEAAARWLEQPYVLFVGGRQHYKNFDGALAGFAGSGLAREGVRLVCTGAPLSPAETSLIARQGLDGQVLATGPVDRGMLVTLYRHAHCLLYPSRFEGFGMPVLEAMTLGCPVVASACTSIPEIAADGAILVPDGAPEGLADAMQSLQDPGLRARMIAAGLRRSTSFSWARSADAHAQVYQSLA